MSAPERESIRPEYSFCVDLCIARKRMYEDCSVRPLTCPARVMMIVVRLGLISLRECQHGGSAALGPATWLCSRHIGELAMTVPSVSGHLYGLRVIRPVELGLR